MGKVRTFLPRFFPILLGAALIVLGLMMGCQDQGEEASSAAGESAGAAQSRAAMEDGGVPGVFEDRILFGQSAAFSGPAEELGTQMMIGIQAAFQERNQAGGVHGRQLSLMTMDDFYEPDSAFANTRRLINREGVFALIGEVGTPTSRSASPLANAEGVPFIAPFTGAEFLRDPSLDNVVNLRASYYQETEEMVARLTEDLGVSRIAVLYQNDSYGQAGLEGARRALERRGLTPVASWYYQRGQDRGVQLGPGRAGGGHHDRAYAPVARAIALACEDIDPVFMAVSFVGSNALAAELGPDGTGVYVTQVVPLPEDTAIPAVAAYHTALKNYDADAAPGFVSLEGYLAGRLAIAGLELCGPDVSRECFLNAIRNAGTINIEGMGLQYAAGDNQGSDAVYVTVIDSYGEYQQVTKLGGER